LVGAERQGSGQGRRMIAMRRGSMG
jgi:hypothetical protein